MPNRSDISSASAQKRFALPLTIINIYTENFFGGGALFTVLCAFWGLSSFLKLNFSFVTLCLYSVIKLVIKCSKVFNQTGQKIGLTMDGIKPMTLV